MYQYKGLEDTIAAVATPAGPGGIGVVRISGSGALAIARQIFAQKNSGRPSGFGHFKLHYGWIKDARGEIIDEVLVSVMKAPQSYTKEDVVEISTHGGSTAVRAVLQAVLAAGARLSEPGEFTKRAFLNGRIDLAQAEAVLDIIQSRTAAFLKVSTHHLKGELSGVLEDIRAALMAVYTKIEAILNFPEDDVGARQRDPLAEDIAAAAARVQTLLASSAHGRILKEGIKIVLCGKPNVGKSSLLNILLKAPRAIVTDIAGTTRDTIEEFAQIQGIPFQIVDTAGILTPRDVIEEEAVRRSHHHIAGADLALLVIDAGRPLDVQDEDVIKKLAGQNILIVMNKCDLPLKVEAQAMEERFPGVRILRVSALKKEGIEEMETAIVEQVWHGKNVDTGGILVSNLRHIKALEECRDWLAEARGTLDSGTSLEFVSEQVKQAVNGLDGITGRNVDEDLLEAIFSQFCIGK